MNSNPNKVIFPCRFSFLHCWEPESVQGSEPKYSVSAIIPKTDTTTVNRIKTAIVGASGYTGGELLRFLHTHGEVEVVAATSRQ